MKWSPSQGRGRANFIELPAPVSDHYSAFAQRVEDLPSEAFPAELVVEAFHVTILPGAARIDVEGFDSLFLQPVPHEIGDELPRYARPSGSLRPAISTPLRFRPVDRDTLSGPI